MDKGKKISFLLLVLLPFQLFSQKGFDILINQKIVIRFEDRIVNLDLLQSEKKVKVQDDKYYYWYNSNDIKITKGGFSGKLLHGHYTEFYLNKNLKEKGQFKYGVKTGEWKSWNINGEYNEISHWKKGRQHGKIELYNEKGGLVKESSYKDGQLNGKTKIYMNDGSVESIKYKKGVPVLISPKGKILKKIFKKKKAPNPEENPAPKKVAKKVLRSSL